MLPCKIITLSFLLKIFVSLAVLILFPVSNFDIKFEDSLTSSVKYPCKQWLLYFGFQFL